MRAYFSVYLKQYRCPRLSISLRDFSNGAVVYTCTKSQINYTTTIDIMCSYQRTLFSVNIYWKLSDVSLRKKKYITKSYFNFQKEFIRCYSPWPAGHMYYLPCEYGMIIK